MDRILDAHKQLLNAENEMTDSLDNYLLIKRGLYYRPKAKGYTGNIAEAGLYTEYEARRRAAIPGVTMKALSLCLAEIDSERDALRKKLSELDDLERDALGLR